MKRFVARSASFGALLFLTSCSISVARQPPFDAPQPLAESAPAPAPPQNTAPPVDAVAVEEPPPPRVFLKSHAGTKKGEAEQASTAAHKVEARRNAEAKRKDAEQRKAKAAALRAEMQRQAEAARHAQEARLAARVAKEAEEKRLADEFKRAFERGRSAWLNAQ